jgi:hypothetical protein
MIIPHSPHEQIYSTEALRDKIEEAACHLLTWQQLSAIVKHRSPKETISWLGSTVFKLKIYGLSFFQFKCLVYSNVRTQKFTFDKALYCHGASRGSQFGKKITNNIINLSKNGLSVHFSTIAEFQQEQTCIFMAFELTSAHEVAIIFQR